MPTREIEALSCGFSLSGLVGLQREREIWFVMSQWNLRIMDLDFWCVAWAHKAWHDIYAWIFMGLA